MLVGLPGLASSLVSAHRPLLSQPPRPRCEVGVKVTARCPAWAAPPARLPGSCRPAHLLLGLPLGRLVHPAQLAQGLHEHSPHLIDEPHDLGSTPCAWVTPGARRAWPTTSSGCSGWGVGLGRAGPPGTGSLQLCFVVGDLGPPTPGHTLQPCPRQPAGSPWGLSFPLGDRVMLELPQHMGGGECPKSLPPVPCDPGPLVHRRVRAEGLGEDRGSRWWGDGGAAMGPVGEVSYGLPFLGNRVKVCFPVASPKYPHCWGHGPPPWEF